MSRLVLQYDKEILRFAAIVRGLVPAHSKYPAIFYRASSSMNDIKKACVEKMKPKNDGTV